MDPRSVFAELKRRNVYKVGVLYGVAAWLLIQAASILLPTFEAPTWVMKSFVTLILLGFPIALILAWAFELTPEGIKRTENVPADAVLPEWSGRNFATLIVTITLIASGLLAFQLWRPRSLKSLENAPQKSIAVLPSDGMGVRTLFRAVFPMARLPRWRAIKRLIAATGERSSPNCAICAAGACWSRKGRE